MEKYKVLQYQSDYYSQWNDFVAKAKNATFLFHRDFMEYHKERFQDFSLIIVPKKNSVNVTPTVHKIASGSTATVGFKTVTNISRTIDFFKKNKFWIYGFVPQSGQLLMNTKFEKKSVFVFGSEGKGLRSLTKDKCDFLINIEVNDKSESLNISSAFSIAAYKSFINL